MQIYVFWITQAMFIQKKVKIKKNKVGQKYTIFDDVIPFAK